MLLEQIFLESAKQAPALALMAVVVWIFLRHLAQRDQRQDKMQDRMIDALERNTEAFGEVKEALRVRRDTA